MNKRIKRVLELIAAVVLFIGINEGLRYLVVDDTRSYTRLMIHELYTSEENIDVAFAGSSHVYCSIVPEVVDEAWGCHSFDLSTSSQQMDGTLALIKELVSRNDVQTIYLEMYYGAADQTNYAERTSATSTYIISDYMRPSLNKAEFLLHSGSSETWVNGIILARRNWTDLFDVDYIRDLLARKNTDEYRNYEWVREDGDIQYYIERGFVARDTVLPEDQRINGEAYDHNLATIEMSADWYASLDSVIQYCREHDVELRMFIAPEPEFTLTGWPLYQEYHDMISEIAEENRLSFYDFNLCRPEYLDTNDRSIFEDTGHLNTDGARQFTQLLCNFYSGKISENALLYDSWTDKLNDEDPCVYGIAGPGTEDGSDQAEYYVIANRYDDMYYRISITPYGDETILIQDYNENNTFTVPASGSGVICIDWYYGDDIDQIQTMEIAY